MALPGFVTHKIGPLPVWGWVGAGGVGILAIKTLRRGSSGSSSASTPATAVGYPPTSSVPETAAQFLTLEGLANSLSNLDQHLSALGTGASAPTGSATTPTANGPNVTTQQYHGQYHWNWTDSAGNVWHQFWDPSGHNSGPINLTAKLGLKPGAALGKIESSVYADQYHLNFTNADGTIQHIFYNPSTGSWGKESLGTPTPPPKTGGPGLGINTADTEGYASGGAVTLVGRPTGAEHVGGPGLAPTYAAGFAPAPNVLGTSQPRSLAVSYPSNGDWLARTTLGNAGTRSPIGIGIADPNPVLAPEAQHAVKGVPPSGEFYPLPPIRMPINQRYPDWIKKVFDTRQMGSGAARALNQHRVKRGNA